MREVDANRRAWGLLSKDHYEHYRLALASQHSLLNRIVTSELGDVYGKRLVHLQCNTGADTVSLARLGAKVTGVDLVADNIKYAKLLAAECGIRDATFVESDIMALMDHHHDKYDIVFTSEGAIGWLPDRLRWAQTIRHLLRDDGFFYVFDSHPFYLAFDESKLRHGITEIGYPYFDRSAGRSEEIGGYASAPRTGENYYWMYSTSEIVNSLIAAGLEIEFLNEHDVLYYDEGGMELVEKGLYRYPALQGKLPCTFSLGARVRQPK